MSSQTGSPLLNLYIRLFNLKNGLVKIVDNLTLGKNLEVIDLYCSETCLQLVIAINANLNRKNCEVKHLSVLVNLSVWCNLLSAL